MNGDPMTPLSEDDRTRRIRLVDAMEDAERRFEEAQRSYLRGSGWTYTSSNNPRCLWLWEKQTVYGKVTAPTEEAIRQQNALDHADGLFDSEEIEG